jgi:hypothetical protein
MTGGKANSMDPTESMIKIGLEEAISALVNA